ncbi:hypothetical protein GCM10022630_40440 [Thermobifida alba]
MNPVTVGPTWKVSWIALTAPLMTALSYPNRNPPIAAAAAIITTWAMLTPLPGASAILDTVAPRRALPEGPHPAPAATAARRASRTRSL